MGFSSLCRGKLGFQPNSFIYSFVAYRQGRNLEVEANTDTMTEHCLLAGSPWQSKAICPGVAMATGLSALPHGRFLKKIPPQLPTGQSDASIF